VNTSITQTTCRAASDVPGAAVVTARGVATAKPIAGRLRVTDVAETSVVIGQVDEDVLLFFRSACSNEHGDACTVAWIATSDPQHGRPSFIPSPATEPVSAIGTGFPQ